MHMLTLSEAAKLAAGELIGQDAVAKRVMTDTRALEQGDLFVALKGERFDAHQFVAQALTDGAAGAMVDLGAAIDAVPVIRVDDTRLALGRLAAGWRDRFAIPVLGVTGSNGKTTVKEMIASILAAHDGADAVLATAGNLNNDIGLPLTLLKLRAQHRYAVIEMGMNHPGEISYLTKLARPTVAMVNNALRAHLAGFDGGIEGVARAKAEIFEGLAEDGTAVINADDAHAELFRAASAGRARLEFGLHQGDVHARKVLLETTYSSFVLVTPVGEATVTLNAPGEHNVRNALAATALATALKMPLTSIVRGLEAFGGVKGRLQPKKAGNGAALIDDTYNANPDSMKAAIDVLATAPAPRWFVMGDIGELGDTAPELHAEVGAYARAKGIEAFYALGDDTRNAAAAYGAGAKHFDMEHRADLIAQLKQDLPANATVLVKGSRFMRMEQVVEALVADNHSKDGES
jgi:UDP-N-acetylmuramoyl-tripeptide--D-alanyl-D-alanine ligase